MKLEKILKNSIIALGISGSLLALSCDEEKTYAQPKATTKQETKTEELSFNTFGKYSEQGYLEKPQMALGDMDGDGDLDVVIIHESRSTSESNYLHIYENRIPQKN